MDVLRIFYGSCFGLFGSSVDLLSIFDRSSLDLWIDRPPKQQRSWVHVNREDPAAVRLPILWLRRSVRRGRRKLRFRGGKEAVNTTPDGNIVTVGC